MPTERSSPPVSTGSVCAMATSASKAPLLEAVLIDVGRQTDRLLPAVDREHRGEYRNRDQDATLGCRQAK